MDSFEKLKDKYKGKRIVLAYSGGIDSLVLAILLSEVANILNVFIKTPYISNYSLKNAIRLAEKYKLNLRVININEIIKNDKYRCYYCKKMFFETLNEIKDTENHDLVVDGTNYDDIFEDRKGLKAKEELNVVSPYVEFKIRKRDILDYAKNNNIEIPPKETCLLTRFYREVDLEDIKKVEILEEFLRNFTEGAIRLRDYIDYCILEVEYPEDIFKNRDKILNHLKKYYKKVLLNLEKYQ
ncbi:ATP-dependent sacrificial sulfur transferase LarE [Methanocaldococcus indicus]|uniref:ATP-dependent sacrificial sulfur transferase LarE n=1 Tax=Methanocaldococcus indicus TaxID=213231 RepID=UPI003C6D5072